MFFLFLYHSLSDGLPLFFLLFYLFIYLFVCVCVYELCGKNICVYWVHFSVLFYWFCNMCRYTF